MKKDNTHQEQIERWAEYVKNNENWRQIHTKFIDMSKIGLCKLLVLTREKIKSIFEHAQEPVWRTRHTLQCMVLDSQFEIARKFYKDLEKTAKGREI
ncbi:hypothetical protein HYW76_00390 [Candidatus Pacearchaeota archaeon]|nr:hypothetical protein [Candidatus Pacearchaeota archaeon]